MAANQHQTALVQGFKPVVAFKCAQPIENPMPKQYTITFADNETLPDFIEKAAEHHGIPPEVFIKRVLNKSVDEFRPPIIDASQFDSLDAFLKGNQYRK